MLACDATPLPTWAPICRRSHRHSDRCVGPGSLQHLRLPGHLRNFIGVLTNTSPVEAYRGAGRPEANYLVERLVDAAARKSRSTASKSAAVTWCRPRRCRMRRRSARPMTAATSSWCWSGVARRWTTPGSPPAEPPPPRAANGAVLGLAYYLEATGGDAHRARRNSFRRRGFVDVYVGTQSTGQGHETAYVQLIADRLGIDGEKIRMCRATPIRPGRRRHRRRAQPLLRGAGDRENRRRRHRERQAGGGRRARGGGRRHRVRGRRFAIAGTDRRIDIISLAASSATKRPPDDGRLARHRRGRRDRRPHLPNGCHIAEVEIDPDTGVDRGRALRRLSTTSARRSTR